MPELHLPVGTRFRITKGPGPAGRSQVTLLVAPPGVEPSRGDLLRRGRLTALVVLPAGVCWPDRIGLQMANDALAHGEVVAFEFTRLADAFRCEQKLQQVLAT